MNARIDEMQKRSDEFIRRQDEGIRICQDALRMRSMTGRLPASEEVRATIDSRLDADPLAQPNDYAIEELARMTVRDSAMCKAARWDAGETRLFARMLKHIVAKTVPTLYTPNQSRMAFPVDMVAPPGARTAAFHRLIDHDDDRLGMISEMGDDVLMVDIGAEEINYNLEEFARGFQWSISELEAAALAQVNLSTEKMAALNRAVERVFEIIMLEGYAAKNIAGVYDDSNVTLTAPTTGTWSGATWAQILADCKKLLEAVKSASGYNYTPNRLAMPSGLWEYMSLRRTNTDLNIMEALQKDYPGLQIIEMHRSDLYDAAGTGPRILAYTYNPDLLKLAEPRRFSLEPPEKHGFMYRIIGRQKLGGAVINVPLTVGYMDGC